MPKAQRKNSGKRLAKTSHAKTRKTAKPSSTAIVKAQPLPVQRERRPQLNRDEVELLKRTVCKGITDDEFALFLWVAKKHKLDPMTRQLHAVKRFVTKHHQDEKGIWVGGEQMSIQIGIDGYRSMAAVNHRDFGGVDEPEYEFANKGDKIPTMARIRVWKKGFDHPSIGIAFWDEYAPTGLDADKAFMWKKMPKHMLAKCAEALALRKAYPDLADIYTDEEMHQHDQDFTSSGRQIVDAEGFAPSGRAVTYEAQQGSHAAAQRVLEEKLAGKRPLAPAEPEKPATAPPKAQIPNTPIEVQPLKGAIEIDYSLDKAFPRIIGDVAALAGFFPKDLVLKWQDEFWHAFAEDVPRIKAICDAQAFKVTEIPAKSPAVPQRGSTAKREGEGKQERASGTSPSPAAPTLVSGTIEEIFAPPNTKSPMRQVKILMADGKKPTFGCFKQDLFSELDKAKGAIEVYVTKTVKGEKSFFNIVGLKRLGSKEWLEDGTPVVQRNQQVAGQKTLYG